MFTCTIAVDGFVYAVHRTRIRNALMKVCLAGAHLSTQLGLALDAVESQPGDNFVLLLSNPESQQYRALYSYDPETGEVSALAFATDCCVARCRMLSCLRMR